MSLSALDVILGWVKKNLCYGKAPTLEADLRKADAELMTLREQAARGPRYGVPKQMPGGTVPMFLGHFGDMDGWWSRTPKGRPVIYRQWGPNAGGGWETRSGFASGAPGVHDIWEAACKYGLSDEPPAAPGELGQVAAHAKRLGVAILMNSSGHCWTLADGDWYAPGLKGDLLTPKCTFTTLLSELAALPKPKPEEPAASPPESKGREWRLHRYSNGTITLSGGDRYEPDATAPDLVKSVFLYEHPPTDDEGELEQIRKAGRACRKAAEILAALPAKPEVPECATVKYLLRSLRAIARNEGDPVLGDVARGLEAAIERERDDDDEVAALPTPKMEEEPKWETVEDVISNLRGWARAKCDDGLEMMTDRLDAAIAREREAQHD